MKALTSLFLFSLAAMGAGAQPLVQQLEEPDAAFLAPAPWLAPEQFSLYEMLAAPQAKALSPLTVSPQLRHQVVQFYQNVYVTTENTAMGWTGTVSPCSPGATSVAYRDATLDRVNFFRALAGLPGNVTFSAAWDTIGQQTALMMVANNALSHAPPNTWLCYTSAGAGGAGESNIALGFGGGGFGAGPKAMKLFMDDFGGGNQIVGHRRWILYPPQANMGTGSTGTSTSANALHVFGAGVWGTRPPTPNGVAWPSAGYFPYQLLPWGGLVGENFGRWSYSLNGANFAAATVSITVNGSTSSPTVVSRTDNGFGDNTIVWQMNVAPNNPGADLRYTVTVSGMAGAGIPSQISYQVIVIDPARLVAGGPDFNHDNRPDLIWSNTTSGATYIWRMNGSSLLSETLLSTIDPVWKVQGVGDFNGDGHNDVVWRHTGNGNTFVWYLVNGVLQSDALLFSLPPEWVIQGVADFNKDGKPDFLMRNVNSGNAFAWFFNNNVAIGDQFLFNIDPSWKVEGVADLNADGQPDLLFRNVNSGLAFAWNSQFSAGTLSLTTSTPPIFSIDSFWEVVQVADWNNDGRPDLLFRNRNTGLVFVWYMNGTTLTTSDFIAQINPSWEIVPRR